MIKKISARTSLSRTVADEVILAEKVNEIIDYINNLDKGIKRARMRLRKILKKTSPTEKEIQESKRKIHKKYGVGGF